MNRIILIGNGFDLAHGLETSYSHFINNFWDKKVTDIRSQGLRSVDDEDIKCDLRYCGALPTWIKTGKDLLTQKDFRFSYNNGFLKLITNNHLYKNWVDIEEFYFSLLLKSIENSDYIKNLNREFLMIKNKLEDYLSSEIEKKQNDLKTIDEISDKIFSDIFYSDDLSMSAYKKVKEFYFNLINESIDLINAQQNDEVTHLKSELINEISKRIDAKVVLDEHKANMAFKNHDYISRYIDVKPESYLFLNFNYTNTEDLYSYNKHYFTGGSVTSTTIHIHGELNNPDNSIIFGYGDEISKDYEKIEDLNNNALLENVKSIKYLETDNYKRLLEYIDSDLYQILIMGHSCGNSDRTLLNTLFEHENCASIKVYYHQESPTKDNYSDIVRNISRNFKDKKVMRERVVNKKHCEPLVKYSEPQ